MVVKTVSAPSGRGLDLEIEKALKENAKYMGNSERSRNPTMHFTSSPGSNGNIYLYAMLTWRD